MEENKNKKKQHFLKVLIIIVFTMLFLVIFPFKINERGSSVAIHNSSQIARRGLAYFITSLRHEGYRVYNQYPTYIQVEKYKIKGSAPAVVNEMAHQVWLSTGRSVKIILVTADGKYVGYYNPEH